MNWKDANETNDKFRETSAFKFMQGFNDLVLGGILRGVLAIVNLFTKK
jgi:hypothetical protein